jgi:hypothetical protein
VIKNSKAWNNKLVMKKHIIGHIKKHLKKKISKTMLLLDNCSCHVTPEVLQSMTKNKMNFLFLPPHTTIILQPVDVGIGKSIKSSVRDKYLQWITENFETLIYTNSKGNQRLRDPSTEEILCWILDSYSAQEEQIRKGNHPNSSVIVFLFSYHV